MIHSTVKKAAVLFASGSIGIGLLTGCSSTSSTNATQTRTTVATPSGSATTANRSATTAKSPIAKSTTAKPKGGAVPAAKIEGDCTNASVLAALPGGSTMDKFDCAIGSGTMWAAARVKPGPRVFFLQTKSGAWKVSTASQICGSTSAGLPKELMAFCPKA